jgi:hypothetical protein
MYYYYMRILWEEVKNDWLKNHRGVSFETISEKISQGHIIDIVANPSPKYPHQGVFVLLINEYTWLVPFVDTGDSLKLVTAFPSRKSHKKYGG